VGGVVSKVELTRVVLVPKGAGLYCSFAGWIRVMKTLYFKFKDKVKYHSVIVNQKIKKTFEFNGKKSYAFFVTFKLIQLKN